MTNVRRTIAVVALIAAPLIALALPAGAGSAHFNKNSISIQRLGNILEVEGKVSGLGDLEQVTIEVTVDAECVNPGGNKPSAGNKSTVSVEEDVPVQNGKANFSIDIDPDDIDPSCSPPMDIVFSNLVITETTNKLTIFFSGPF